MLRQLEGLERWGPLVLQLLLGFVFAMHGAQKLLGAFQGPGVAGLAGFFQKLGITPALFWAWIVTITEFFGGICIFFGFVTRFWAVGLVIDMAVAVLKVHVANGFFWAKGGLEFPMTLGFIALAVFLMGPSFLSLDRAMGLEKRTA